MDECPVREEGGLQRCSLGGILHEVQDFRGRGSLDKRGMSRQGSDEDPSTLAGGNLSFSGAVISQMLASLEMLEVRKIHTVTMMMGTNDVSLGELRMMMRLPEEVNCLLQVVKNYLDPTIQSALYRTT